MLFRSHGIGDDRLILQGQSLGTGIAVEMALRGYGKKLILISPYTSMVDMGKLTLPIFPNELLVHERYLNLAKAPRVTLPVLVVHGTEDEIIPVRMGRSVAEALPHARLLTIDGGHHNDLFIHRGRLLLEELTNFYQY